MKNIRVFFLSENFQFLEAKFSIYLNRLVFVMVLAIRAHFFGTLRLCRYSKRLPLPHLSKVM